jgi:hypothetical protein
MFAYPVGPKKDVRDIICLVLLLGTYIILASVP